MACLSNERVQLKSKDPLVLVHALSDALIDSIRQDNRLGGADVAGHLSTLRDAIWPLDKKQPPESEMRDKFRQALNGFDGEKKSRLFEGYARLGHLYEIAGLAARHNYLAPLLTNPAGVNAYTEQQTDATSAVAKLNQPVFEVVMTMHPTNTHSLESMRAQRKLFKALQVDSEDNIKQAVNRLVHTPVLHQVDGHDANFTVHDETAVTVHFLDNVYEDMTATYGQFDRSLAGKFKDAYHPQDLKLKIRLGSWGSSGDKDGNNNVTAETTLEAIAMHMEAITGHYKEDLAKIPKLVDWKVCMEQAHADIHNLLKEATDLRKDSEKVRKGTKPIDAQVLSDRFDVLSDRLSAVYRSLDEKQLINDLEAAYQDEKNPQMLDLLRKVRIFGFRFAKIEYRETAEEYARVVDALVPGYAGFFPKEKAERLTAALQRNEAEGQLTSQMQRIITEGATKPYDENSAMPIAYHTVKRMALARDFPEFIQDNVLAECGRLEGEHAVADVTAQGVANILEAQYIQHMIPEKDGRRVRLGIVPLFEEPNTMMNIDTIMRAAYENPAYETHLAEMASLRDGKKTQQVQIAHSDNARRSGLLAARAYIHEAHQKLRDLNEEKHIVTQFFEGGSVSDAYRNGVRAVSASVNAFQLHDFAKFTFQGGDLVNYFNAPSSTVRLFTRNLTHAAQRFDASGRMKVRGSERTTTFERRQVPDRRPNDYMDDIAVAALKDTLVDYERDDFQKDTMGILLAVLDYEGETRAGGRGSRAAKRGQPTALGDVALKPEGGRLPHLASLTTVDIENVRTISFSEAWQHAGIVPSWIGSQKLAQHLLERAKEKFRVVSASTIRIDLSTPEGKAKARFLQEFANIASQGRLTEAQLSALYEKSPVFRDAQDRSAFALAMTNPNSLKWLTTRLERLPEDEAIRKAKAYMAHLQETYQQAGELACASLTGRKLESDIKTSVTSALPMLEDDLRHKAAFRDFLLFAKLGGMDEHQRGVLHNAGDIVVHGRFLAADDPTYGKARADEVLKGRS